MSEYKCLWIQRKETLCEGFKVGWCFLGGEGKGGGGGGNGVF